MKKRLLTLLVMLQICFVMIAQSVQPDIVRVKLTREAADRIASTIGVEGVVQASSVTPFSTGVTTFDAVCRNLNAVQMKRVFRYSKKFEKRHRKAGLDLWYEIKIGDNVQPYSAVKSLNVLSEVTHAETVMIPTMYADDMPTNDPYLPRQWHYKNTGQSGGTSGADINLFEAWKKTKGSKDVIVAIIDGGLLLEHPDLKRNLWVNEAEYNGEKGKDNDGNDYINDIYGWNFVDNTPFISPHFHGTHVAGTVAAENNNGEGVAGVAGGTGNGDGVRLMSCQIFAGKYQTTATATNFAEPFMYAADNGAVIAQCSWGWNQAGYVEKAVLEAIDYFIENAGRDKDTGEPLPNTKMAGGIVFFASGNLGLEGLYYPGCYKNVIAVAATDHENKMTTYSNYGTWIDIVAPGGYVTRGSDNEGIWSTSVSGGYEPMEGTSMACPHVAGVAALVLSSVGHQAYTPELLWTRMKNACINLDDLNPDFAGYMGVGIIDAAKAVQVDDGIPPNAVTDLTTSVIAQDYIDVTFTAPADPDNVSAARYDLRYSLTPITNANFDELSGIVADARVAGSTENMRLENLTPQTEYYIALKSRDIWGNSSDLSNILQVSTSSLPKVAVNIPSDTLLFNIADVNANPLATQDIKLKNVGQGELRYNLLYNGVKDPRTVPDDFELLHEVTNYNGNAANLQSGTFGDDGASNRFTAASKFTVDVDKFYFTHLKAAFQTRTPNWEEPTEDFLIRVYKGGETPNEGILLYNNRIPFRQFSATDQVFTLGEGMNLLKGDVVWVVFEFPADYYMPMGINHSLGDDLKGLYFFSEDLGKNWNDINTTDGLGISKNIAYRVFPQSTQESLADYMAFNPESGKALENDIQDATITVDATDLANGTYISYVKVFTNDQTQPLVSFPAKIVVDGHASQLDAINNIDYQTVIIGNTASYDLKIGNKGLGDLVIDSLFVTDDVHFNVTPTKLTVKSNETGLVRVTFTPDNTGLLIKSLKLQMASSTQTIVLNGNGVMPPEASVNPTEVEITLPAGGTAESSFKIKNTGVYQLEYKIPAFEGISTFSITDDHTGYVATSSREAGGPAFKWEDMSVAEDITQKVMSTGNKATVVDLGFNVDYYGHTFDSLSILESGMLSMGIMPHGINVAVDGFPKPQGPGKMFSPLYLHGKNMLLSQGKVLYKKAPGYAVVEYRHVCSPKQSLGWFDLPASGTIDVQTVIYNNGVIEYYYKNFEEGPEIQVGLFMTAEAGIESIDSSDGLTITAADPTFMLPGEQLAIQILPPVPSFIKSLTPAKGLVAPGDEVEVKLNLAAGETVLDSVYYNHIFITSNDPVSTTIDLPLKVTVTGESKVTTLVTDINYGEVPLGVSKAVNVSVNNAGGKSFEITSASSSNPVFNTQAPAGTTVKGFSSLVYNVVFTPDAVGDFTDEIVINTDIVGAEPIRISLTGKGVNASDLVLDALDQSYEMNSGEIIDTAIVVRNEGDGELEYILSSSEWIKPQESGITTFGHFDNSGYYWADSKSNTGVTYEWITFENATVTDVFGIMGTLKYTLPFEFPYYGKKYNELMISSHGRLSFNLNEAEGQRKSGPFMLPADDDKNNMIVGLSPVAGFYPGGSYLDPNSSMVYAEDFEDKVVFTWDRVLAGTFSLSRDGSTATFQIILYKDGSIKFQYHDFTNADWAQKESIIGIENEDGSDGLVVGYIDGYPEDGLAVMITPGLKRTLAPHQSERIPLKIDPSKVMDGNHVGKIIVAATDLTRKMDSVRVDLNFHGTGKLVLSTDSVGFGDTYTYKINDFAYNNYERYMNIKNVGSKAVEISNIALPPYVTLTNMSSGTIAPFEVVEGTLNFTPTADGIYDNKIVFTYGGELAGQSDEVKVTANLMYPPVEELTSSVPNNDYVVTLLASEKDTTGFTLKNAGLTDMNYQFNIEMLTEEEYNEATGKSSGDEVKQAPVYTPFDMNKINSYSFTASDDVMLPTIGTRAVQATYIDSIVYSNFFPQSAFEWTTTETPFVYANRYDVTKMGGFNLTHIGNQIRNYNDNVEVTIEVLYGKDYSTAEVLHTTKTIVNSNDSGDPSVDMGQYEYFELDEPVSFMQGETFWIRFSQQSGVGFNQMMFYHGDISLADNFLLVDGSTLYKWYDINEGMAPMIACYSDEQSIQESWVTTYESAGTLAAGLEANVEVRLNPEKLRASERIGYARISVASNDPVERTNEFFVAMTVNQAPAITSDQTEYDVNEGQQLVVDLAITDVDGDTFTYEVDDQVATGQPAATLHASGYGFTLNPDYGTAGTWSYVVSATDSHNQKSEYPVTVNVLKVNRAPISAGINDTTVYVDRAPIAINLAAVFSDPDGDALTYTVESYDAIFVAAQTVTSTLRVTGWAEGSSIVTVRATDADGLYVDETFNVTVLSGTGIGGNDYNGNVSVYPNPVKNELNIELGENWMGKVTIDIIDLAGKIAISEIRTVEDVNRVDVSSLPSGVYQLRITSADKKQIVKIIKD